MNPVAVPHVVPGAWTTRGSWTSSVCCGRTTCPGTERTAEEERRSVVYTVPVEWNYSLGRMS